MLPGSAETRSAEWLIRTRCCWSERLEDWLEWVAEILSELDFALFRTNFSRKNKTENEWWNGLFVYLSQIALGSYGWMVRVLNLLEFVSTVTYSAFCFPIVHVNYIVFYSSPRKVECSYYISLLNYPTFHFNVSITFLARDKYHLHAHARTQKSLVNLPSPIPQSIKL